MQKAFTNYLNLQNILKKKVNCNVFGIYFTKAVLNPGNKKSKQRFWYCTIPRIVICSPKKFLKLFLYTWITFKDLCLNFFIVHFLKKKKQTYLYFVPILKIFNGVNRLYHLFKQISFMLWKFILLITKKYILLIFSIKI